VPPGIFLRFPAPSSLSALPSFFLSSPSASLRLSSGPGFPLWSENVKKHAAWPEGGGRMLLKVYVIPDPDFQDSFPGAKM
jgi:hypothetical protein